MRSFQKSNKVKFAIYNMEAEIDSVLVNIDLPYFFVFDSSRRTDSMYIPHKEIPFLTEVYLSSVKRKFFTDLE